MLAFLSTMLLTRAFIVVARWSTTAKHYGLRMIFIMAALWNRQAIIFSSCGFFFLSFFFFLA